MKRENINISILTLVGLIAGISFFSFSFKNVQADTSYQQPIFSTTTYPNLSITGSYQNLGNLESGNTINSITVKGRTNTSVTSGTIFLVTCFNTTFNESAGNCTLPTQTGSIQATVPNYTDQNEDTFFTFSFNTSTTTNSAHQYAIQFMSGGGFGIQTVAGSNNPNSWANGNFVRSTGAAPTTDFNVKDAYFKLGENLQSNNSLTWELPVHNEVIESFTQWQVNYNLTATTTGDVVLRIYYDTASSTLPLNGNQGQVGTTSIYTDASSIYITDPLNQETFSGEGTKVIFKNAATLLPNDYYAIAHAEIRTYTGLHYAFATSTVIRFTLTETNEPSFGTTATSTFGGIFGFATTTGDVWNQCSQLGVNFWQEYFCNVITLLFKPHDNVIDITMQTLSKFLSVFPFNIPNNMFIAIQNGINTGNATTSAAFNIPWFGSLTGNPNLGATEIPLFDYNTTEDLFGTSTRNMIYDMQAWIMYLLTIFTIVSFIL